ncbi:hypothetical protein C0993_002310 [Termitomyces sp. T159_Od127]|nr:hypothetical protein C0993_002310 [Termitomyces sp. T159_Od127]
MPEKDFHRTVLGQLINDLAELRESTTIIHNEPAARYRLTRPFFEPEASLPWPPTYPPAPLRYDFYGYGDCPSEESSSPSLSVASEPSKLSNRNDYVAVAESPSLSCELSPWFNQVSPVFQSKAPSPARKVITHIIGEDDPFNPFSYDITFEDKDTRNIDTCSGKIFAPIPKLPTAAALANFEAMALEAMMPAVKNVIKTESSSNKNGTVFSDDETSPSLFFSKETTPIQKESRQAPAVARVQESITDDSEVLYQTGPKPQARLVDDMISLLSLEPGPFKYKKMTQLWIANGQGAAGVSLSEMTDDEVYDALIPVPPQPPTVYPTNRQQRSLLRILSNDYRPSCFS